MDLALRIIPNFNEAKSQRERKQEIAAYQKAHGLDEDGIIGKETYIELWAHDLANKASDRIEEFGISPTTLTEIQEFFEKNP